MRRVVVVGASLAGHHAADSLRRLGYDGTVTVIGGEPHRPYDRYPLSKAFLCGDVDRRGLDLSTGVADVDWRLGSTATSLDLQDRHVLTDDGDRIPFDGLVVASGARARHRTAVQGLDGAFVLRTVDDAIALRAALAAPGRRVVVAGGGLIGAEIAATSVEAGHDTTWLHPGDLPTVHAVGLPVAEHLSELHRAAGVELRARTRVRQVLGEHDAVTGVRLDDGSRVPADVVVMATGTEPNVEWLRGSGLVTEGGLHCAPTLFALGSDRVVGAGDVVRTQHPLAPDESVRVEHWASTRLQAARAVENLLTGADRARPLTAMPEFGTRILGARFRGVGFPHLADRGGVVWGSLRSGSAVVALARGNTSVALVSVNADRVLHALAGRLWPDQAAGRSAAAAAEPVAS
jgi:NADPH-dependent 2,4-dienoyl-CoA reductase/sulfur reductase-like enzyme